MIRLFDSISARRSNHARATTHNLNDMAGKGDSPRPVNGDKFRRSWERIFRGNADRPQQESVMDRFNDECRKVGFDPYRDYPAWICWDCGKAYGRREPGVACWHNGECGICGMICPVTEPRDFGHLNWPTNSTNDTQ